MPDSKRTTIYEYRHFFETIKKIKNNNKIINIKILQKYFNFIKKLISMVEKKMRNIKNTKFETGKIIQ